MSDDQSNTYVHLGASSCTYEAEALPDVVLCPKHMVHLPHFGSIVIHPMNGRLVFFPLKPPQSEGSHLLAELTLVGHEGPVQVSGRRTTIL